MDKLTLILINQLFEIERKLVTKQVNAVDRNFERVKHDLQESGIKVIDPTGEKYEDTRTDCQASIVGDLGKNMVITRTMKPIVISNGPNGMELVQRGTVIVEKA
ncbi:MAG: hypothetical protein HRT58_01405 [Crocinitomicaceae bacterium]|nr:hypothetical protein [Flavobacteriales bacterium]NQZ34280.1 hypothetical protein [Crocinitomicaceae bacterium]PHR36676.1 MAG: hypothetical protein COA38_01230 [Fluviicola sp.]